ncbi:MAG: hypothetical protein AAGE52_03110 [Myxococcota bacterium]
MRLALFLALSLVACGSEDPAPPAPIGGNPPPTGGGVGGGRDGGVAETDAGPTDGGVVPTCVEVPAGDIVNRVVITQGGTPVDFVPQSGFVTFNPNSCDGGLAEVVVVLTEDPNCSLGIGRRVVFVAAADEIAEGLIPVGAPIQIAFSEALAVRYIEPAGAAGESIIWGNCNDGSDGDVTWDFLDGEGGTQAADFNMTLVDCSPEATEAPLQVVGSLSLPLDITFADVCTEPAM